MTPAIPELLALARQVKLEYAKYATKLKYWEPTREDELAAGVEWLAAENERLKMRQSELLQLVANISQSTPLDSEVSEALNQRGVMLAEIGTLRHQLAASQAEVERLRADFTMVCTVADDRHAELAHCHAEIDSRGEQLAAALAAKDEACDIAQTRLDQIHSLGPLGQSLQDQIAALRQVGRKGTK